MKRNILILLVISLAIILVVTAYRYLEEEYSPKAKREHYRKSTSSLFKEKAPYVPRGLKHEVVAQEEQEVEEKFETQAFDEFFKIRRDALLNFKKDCDERMEALIPREKVLDPSSEDFDYSLELINSLAELTSYSVEGQELVLEYTEGLKYFLGSKEKYNTYELYKLIKEGTPCLGSNVSMFIDTLFEASISKKWNYNQIKEAHRVLIPTLYDSINKVHSPEALVSALNGLRAAGSPIYGVDYLEELDGVYDKISEFEDSFFRDMERARASENPIEIYDAYLSELELISDEIKYIMTQRFFDSLNSN